MAVVFFIIAVICTIIKTRSKNNYQAGFVSNTLLHFMMLLNVGIPALIAAYMHVFLADWTAEMIGWQPGSPFQFEIGMANLAFGVLGLHAFFRPVYTPAVVIGWSVLLLGCFVGHILDYIRTGNDAPYNFGVYIWFNDLFLPILALALLFISRKKQSI